MKHSDTIQRSFEQQVEVFKTNISSEELADHIVQQLSLLAPGLEANFDLDDCDRILRVKTEAGTVDHQAIIQIVLVSGGQIEVLE